MSESPVTTKMQEMLDSDGWVPTTEGHVKWHEENLYHASVGDEGR